MEDIVDFNIQVPEEAEQLDQLQEGDSLINRGVDDVLDEGYTTPERWSPRIWKHVRRDAPRGNHRAAHPPGRIRSCP